VSWGTKGSDKTDTLPTVKVIQGDKEEGPAIEEINRSQDDIDEMFEKTVKRALTPYKAVEEKEGKDLDDSYKSFRTGLVVSWLFSNCVLGVVITSENFDTLGIGKSSSTRTATFFKFLLYATAALSIVRFIGFLYFMGRTGIMCCFARR